MKKKVFQILVLTAAVWLASPATSEATSMSFSTGTFVGNSVEFGIGPARYDFGLVFDLVQTAFTVDVTVDTTPDLSGLPPGYVCVPLTGPNVPVNGATECVMFTAVASDPNAWVGDYTLTITWQADTNALYPNTPVAPSGLGRIRILHFDSNGMTDITLPNSYCTTCVVDPAIGGKDDNFSDFMVVQAPVVNPNAAVPEPATMMLLGSGLAILAVRLRRRRRLS